MKSFCQATLRLLLPIWLGGALAVSFLAIPVVFSPAIKSVLPAESVGLVAQSILGRFFWVQLAFWAVCSCAWLATRPRPGYWTRLGWAVLGIGSVLAATWLHPKLRLLHQVKYDATQSVGARETAAANFRRWHGISQVGNLAILLTLGGLTVAVQRGSRDSATDSPPPGGGLTPPLPNSLIR